MGQLVALRQTGGAQRVALGEQAAGRVGDHLAAVGVVAVENEALATADRAQAQAFVGQQFVVGEAVVQLDHADILRADTGLFVDLVGSRLSHVKTGEADHRRWIERHNRVRGHRLGEDRHVSAQAVFFGEGFAANNRSSATASRRARHQAGHDAGPDDFVVHHLFGGHHVLEQRQGIIGGVAAGLGADRGEGLHRGAVALHVLSTGAAETPQGLRDVRGIGGQRFEYVQEACARAGTVIPMRSQRAGLHLLEAQRQGALDLTAGHGGAGQIQGSRTGGAVVVDVDHRNTGQADLVQGGLATGGIAEHVAGEGHLDLVVANTGVLQRKAQGLCAHFGVGRAGARLAERNHADAGNDNFVAHVFALGRGEGGLKFAGDQFALDFVGSAEDAGNAQIDKGAGHRVLEHVAVTTVQLDHVVQVLPQGLGGEQFGDGGFFHGQLATHVFADVVIDHGAHCDRGSLGIGQLEFGVLEIPHRPTEGLAVLDVLDGLLQQTFQANGGVDGDAQSLLWQLLHHVGEAFTFLAQQVVDRHAHIVEKHLRGVGRTLADLVQLAATAEAFAAGFNHDQADAFGACRRVGFAGHQNHVAIEATADKGLAAIDDVFVAIADRSGTRSFQIAAATWLGHAQGKDGFATADARQPAMLLLFGTETHDVHRNDVRVQAETDAGHAGAVHFFVDDCRVAEVSAATAIHRRNHGAQQTFAAGLEPSLAVDLAGLVPFGLTGHAFALEEAARGFAEHFMIFAKDGSLNVHYGLQCL
ncbi:hypothetical protein D3C71_955300 [compost metagenome]